MADRKPYGNEDGWCPKREYGELDLMIGAVAAAALLISTALGWRSDMSDIPVLYWSRWVSFLWLVSILPARWLLAFLGKAHSHAWAWPTWPVFWLCHTLMGLLVGGDNALIKSANKAREKVETYKASNEDIDSSDERGRLSEPQEGSGWLSKYKP